VTRLARLRDAFIGERQPRGALFCTYGFDARFFEAEILPAMLPNSLSLDREAGSRAAYLNASDLALQRCDVSVFYDHLLGEGPELIYGSWPVDVLPRRFHAKLAMIRYEDRVRVVVGSANLTRAAWTRLLELFVVDDLVPGEPHPWAGGLRRFVAHLAGRVPAGQPRQREAVRAFLDDIPDGPGREWITSTWDAALLDALFDGVRDPRRISVVTPFFEGSEGPGVFDALAERAPNAKGDLYVSVSLDAGSPQIAGPPDKLGPLLATGAWTLHGVRSVWDGDEEAAPLRALHGKVLAVTHADGTRVMVGSANVTRAALLGLASASGRPGPANVELVLFRDTTNRDARAVLPQADRLMVDDVDIVPTDDPTGEDDDQPAGPERYVLEATYRARMSTLTVVLAGDAPPVTLTYEGRPVAEAASGNVTITVELRAARFVVVDDGLATGLVPFTVVDPERLLARGTARRMSLETFFDVLAGGRDLPLRGVNGGIRSPGMGEGDGVIGSYGAIPWRRYLAAVVGLGQELERERHTERGLRFTLENPIRLAGLVEHLEYAYARCRFTAADLVYALYELERELARVGSFDSPRECAAILADAHGAIAQRRTELVGAAGEAVAAQIRVLTRGDSAR
jgi:hypothetical protein